jgi:hypothetical protein
LIYWIPVLPEGNASPTHLYAKTAAQKALAACADAWKTGFVRLKSVRRISLTATLASATA